MLLVTFSSTRDSHLSLRRYGQCCAPVSLAEARAALQGAYVAAADRLDSPAAVLDYGLAFGAGLEDAKLLDMHSASSWRAAYAWQASLDCARVCVAGAL